MSPPGCPRRTRDLGDGVVGHAHDDELDLLQQRVRLGEGAGAGYQGVEPVATSRVARCHGDHRPAGSGQCDAERGADRAGTHDPDQRWLTGRTMPMGMRMVVDVGLVAVPVSPRRLGIEVDPRLADGVGGALGVVPPALVLVVRPGSHDQRARPIVGWRYSSTRRV
jgi:hypothetical protein